LRLLYPISNQTQTFLSTKINYYLHYYLYLSILFHLIPLLFNLLRLFVFLPLPIFIFFFLNPCIYFFSLTFTPLPLQFMFLSFLFIFFSFFLNLLFLLLRWWSCTATSRSWSTSFIIVSIILHNRFLNVRLCRLWWFPSSSFHRLRFKIRITINTYTSSSLFFSLNSNWRFLQRLLLLLQ